MLDLWPMILKTNNMPFQTIQNMQQNEAVSMQFEFAAKQQSNIQLDSSNRKETYSKWNFFFQSKIFQNFTYIIQTDNKSNYHVGIGSWKASLPKSVVKYMKKL